MTDDLGQTGRPDDQRINVAQRVKNVERQLRGQ